MYYFLSSMDKREEREVNNEEKLTQDKRIQASWWEGMVQKMNTFHNIVKEIMRSILNKTDKEKEELRNWNKFRSKIYQARHRARVKGSLNFETKRRLQVELEKYMARICQDYKEILNKKCLNGDIESALQLSFDRTNENVSHRQV